MPPFFGVPPEDDEEDDEDDAAGLPVGVPPPEICACGTGVEARFEPVLAALLELELELELALELDVDELLLPQAASSAAAPGIPIPMAAAFRKKRRRVNAERSPDVSDSNIDLLLRMTVQAMRDMYTTSRRRLYTPLLLANFQARESRLPAALRSRHGNTIRGEPRPDDMQFPYVRILKAKKMSVKVKSGAEERKFKIL